MTVTTTTPLPPLPPLQPIDAMPDIKIGRYTPASTATHGFLGWIEPAKPPLLWIGYIDRYGHLHFYSHRDPETGAIDDNYRSVISSDNVAQVLGELNRDNPPERIEHARLYDIIGDGTGHPSFLLSLREYLHLAPMDAVHHFEVADFNDPPAEGWGPDGNPDNHFCVAIARGNQAPLLRERLREMLGQESE